MDRPWKVLALIVVGIFAVVGWVAYQHQDELVEAWLTPSEIGLKDTHTISEALAHLASETDADLAQVSSVDQANNQLCFLAARDRQGNRPVVPKPRCINLISDETDYAIFVQVLKGQPVCLTLTGKTSPLAQRLASRNLTRGCVIPIPISAQNWKGIIILGWITPADKGDEEIAVTAARKTAESLINR